jgi:ankyrin repeat protein
LNSLIGKKSPKAIKIALQNLGEQSTDSNKDKQAQALYSAYEETMERIERQDGDSPELAKEALSWITFAKRPLTTLELQDAMAVEINKPELDKDNLPDIEDIVSVCAGLVTVDEESHIIRLVHYTTQEYFEQTAKHWFPDAETDIAQACITYLSFNNFEQGYCRTEDEFEERLHSYRLYKYAAQNWGHHARKVFTFGQELSQAAVDFLESKAKVEASSQALLAIKRYSWLSDCSQEFPRQMTGLHLTAYFGVDRAMNILLEKGLKADSKDSYGWTPLSYAAGNGHEAIVKLLLEKGAAIDLKNRYSDTPLLYAAENGHEAIVRLLLEKGAVVDSFNADHRTPLSRAAVHRHGVVVKLLLNKGAAVNWRDYEGQTPLSCAAKYGHEAIVQLLLARDGINADSKCNGRFDAGRTPLSYAAQDGHKAIVQLLLVRDGVDADSKATGKYNAGRTPLSYAAEKGHEAVVKLLLARKGVDTESKDNDFGRTPLSWAAEKGHEAVVKLLLEKDAAIETEDNLGWTAL